MVVVKTLVAIGLSLDSKLSLNVNSIRYNALIVDAEDVAEKMVNLWCNGVFEVGSSKCGSPSC